MFLVQSNMYHGYNQVVETTSKVCQNYRAYSTYIYIIITSK